MERVWNKGNTNKQDAVKKLPYVKIKICCNTLVISLQPKAWVVLLKVLISMNKQAEKSPCYVLVFLDNIFPFLTRTPSDGTDNWIFLPFVTRTGVFIFNIGTRNAIHTIPADYLATCVAGATIAMNICQYTHTHTYIYMYIYIYIYAWKFQENNFSNQERLTDTNANPHGKALCYQHYWCI